MSVRTARYVAIIAPDAGDPGTLRYDIRRLVPAREAEVLLGPLARRGAAQFPDGRDLPMPFADLTTPPCDRAIARRIAMEWIGAHDPGAFHLEVDWHDEPIVPTRESAGVGGRYAERGRGSLWRRWLAGLTS